MNLPLDVKQFRFVGERKFRLTDIPTGLEPLYTKKSDYKSQLRSFREEIDDLQNRMYAHDRYGLLLIFQAMDAGGKDSTIKHVMSGVNPHGVDVHSFKKPSENELDHDFLWRTTLNLPRRGHIGIFNRSYYEEVLVVRVHPKILSHSQRIPKEFLQDVDLVFEQRYEDIRNFESYLYRQGYRIMKFFLNVSKEEQRQRFLRRIERSEKNWKFNQGDVDERKHWDAYMRAYETMINATATPEAPWYVVPADDKKNMRLIVSDLILGIMRDMKTFYPQMSEAHLLELAESRRMLENEA